jgi:hypothetical protein
MAPPNAVFSIAVGSVMTLIYYYGAAQRSRTTAMFLGFLWAALTAGPFVVAWYVLSWSGYPLWPAIPAGYILPLFLLISTIWHDPTPDVGLKVLTRFPQLRQVIYLSLLLLTSLYFGFGLPLLAVFIYAQVVHLSFGTVGSVYWSGVAIIGGMLSGGIYGLIHRRHK